MSTIRSLLCEFVQNGLNGDKGRRLPNRTVAFDAFAAAELHLNVHGLQFQTAAGEGFREDVQRPGTVLPMTRGEATECCHVHFVVAESRIRCRGYGTSSSCMEGFVVQGHGPWLFPLSYRCRYVPGDELLYLFGIAVGQFHVDFRITSPGTKRGCPAGGIGRWWYCAYPDVAGGSAGIVRERVVQVGVDGEDTVCVVEHQLTVCGKGRRFPCICRTRGHLTVFEFADVSGDDRLQNEQFGGSCVKLQPVGDRLEYFQSEIGYHLIRNSCGEVVVALLLRGRFPGPPCRKTRNKGNNIFDENTESACR